MEGHRVPPNGELWHDLREDRVVFQNDNLYSEKTKRMVRWMLRSDPSERPSIEELLHSYLLTDQEKENKFYKTACKSLILK